MISSCAMRTLGNLLWLLFGGLFLGLGWFLAGVVMVCTIVGIPWARACFVMGGLALWPFGREAVDRRAFTGQADVGTGALGTLGNVVWFLLAGIWLALGHALSALLCALTIVGIPFALQHVKLASISLAPIGKLVVTTAEADAARARGALPRR
ncbi:MAG: YccF domain-containing protein [Polyangiales bacterium]